MVDVGNFDNLDEAYENGLATGRKEGARNERNAWVKLIDKKIKTEVTANDSYVAELLDSIKKERLKELDKK